MQTIFPTLRYADARGAIQSLCASFGFIELFCVPESGPFVRHARVHDRARSASAEIVCPPKDTDFGAREYHVRDFEGHPWTFTTDLPRTAAE